MDEEYMTLTLKDLWRALTKSKRVILYSGFMCAMLLLGYKLTRPVAYTAEAYFRNRDKESSDEGASLTKLLLGPIKQESSTEAIRLMLSRRVMDPMIQDLGLQATLNDDHSPSIFRRIWENLYVQKESLLRKPVVILQNEPPLLTVAHVRYSGESVVNYDLTFTDDSTYTVFQEGKRLAAGKVGSPISIHGTTWVLNVSHAPSVSLKGENVKLTLRPLQLVAKDFSDEIEIKVDQEDKNVLVLKYVDTNRYKAREIVNRLMDDYRNYLIADNERTAEIQLNYLHKRQKEVFGEQHKLLQAHADSFSKDMSEAGFVDAETEKKYLLKKYVEINERVDALDLQAASLELALNGSDKETRQHLLEVASSTKDENLLELLTLKQQRDSLSLALRQKGSQFDDQEQLFYDQVADLDILKANVGHINTLIASLRKDEAVPLTSPLVNEPKLLVGIWFKRLQESYRQGNKSLYLAEKENFSLYLQNLLRLYTVFVRVLEERLAYQFHADEEMQGIDLSSAGGLILQYNQDASQLQGEMKQYQFLAEQMTQPSFDLSSLGTTLEDQVSQGIIKKSSEIALLLHDDAYRTEKEKERLRSESDLQKRFLREHLSQMASLYSLRLDLIRKKIISLQSIMLDQVQQKIALLEKHVQDALEGKLEAIKLEKQFLQRHLETVNSEMSHLPSKWISEQLLQQSLELNKVIVEEVTRLVEGKNISHHLELIRSEPLERAELPLKPKSPALPLYLMAGFLGGCFLSGVGCLIRSTVKGVQVSEENLRLSGFNVAGSLTLPLRESLDGENLAALRHIVSLIDGQERTEQYVLFFGNQAVNIAHFAASLLSKRGKKTIVLNFCEEGKGLMPYLEGKSEDFSIEKFSTFDQTTGLFSSDIVEYFASSRFTSLLKSLRENYDFILTAVPASPISSESLTLIPHGDAAIVALGDECLHQLACYQEIKSKCLLTFVLVNSNS